MFFNCVVIKKLDLNMKIMSDNKFVKASVYLFFWLVKLVGVTRFHLESLKVHIFVWIVNDDEYFERNVTEENECEVCAGANICVRFALVRVPRNSTNICRIRISQNIH